MEFLAHLHKRLFLMLLSKVKNYVLIATIALLVFTSGALIYLWNRNVSLNYQLKVVQTQYADAQKNLSLVNKQLSKERMLRENVEEVLNQLKDVPDETYSEELDSSIRSVLNDFHNRLRSSNNFGR